jgi:Predicted glycosyltransferases
MGKYPKVYIIVLNYNAYKETLACIDSIRTITYPDYEVVVVDNNSTDGSTNILKEALSDCIFIGSDKNNGYAGGNNLGIQHAMDMGAECICLLNNDVEVERAFLEPLIDDLLKNENIAMSGPCICDYSDRNKIQAMGANINLYTGLAQGKYKGKAYDKLQNKIIEVDYLGGACFVFKAAVVKKIGLIPENYFLFFEETEFCLKAKRQGYRLICNSYSRVYHKGSTTISKFKGLGYYFLNRNRVVFMRRNANLMEKVVFSFYVVMEGIGRMLIKKEPIDLFKYYLKGCKQT